MEAWLQAIPPERRDHSPRVSLGFGWLHLLRANFDQAQVYLSQAQAAIAALEPGQGADALRAENLALQANLAQSQGNLPASIEAARAALILVPAGSGRVAGLAWLALGGAYRQSAPYAQAAEALQQAAWASWQSQDWVTWMLAVSQLTLMSIQYGRLRFAAETASGAVEQLDALQIAPPTTIGAIYGALGLVYFETNRLDAARENFSRGIRLATFSGHNGSLVYNKVNLARLLQAEGNLPAAAQVLDEVAGLLRMGAPGWMRPEFIDRQTSLLLTMGKPAEAEAVLRQSGVTPADEVSRRTDWIHLAWLRLLVAQKSPVALALAERILHFSEADGRDVVTLQALILGALAGGGADWLVRALELGEEEGYVMVFLEAGDDIKKRLKDEGEKMKTGRLRDYLEKLLAIAGIEIGSSSSFHLSLTDRELEVLRLLAEGLSYAEIADRLVVSVNTVRYHVKGIYGKLGVEKQAQAVEKGRELGLI
jgi:LuxR family maltose regulon positive regulatory protein